MPVVSGIMSTYPLGHSAPSEHTAVSQNCEVVGGPKAEPPKRVRNRHVIHVTGTPGILKDFWYVCDGPLPHEDTALCRMSRAPTA